MKTIKELNEKIWYRILKVVFLLFFILSFFNLLVFSYNIYFSNKNNINHKYMTFLNRNTIQQLITDLNIKESQADEFFKGLTEKGYTLEGYNDKSTGSINEKNLFYKISPILLLFRIMVSFFTIKHTFYYIVLGKFRPKE